jgi:signal peptidase II
VAIFWCILVIVIIDRVTKAAAVACLSTQNSIPVIPGIFHFTLAHNTGAAFSIMRGQTHLLIGVTVCAIVFIIAHFKKSSALERFSLSLILAGAVGNLIDRVFLGYVIDFIDFRIWPVFNVADSAITCGAVLLAWSLLKPSAGKKNDKAADKRALQENR